MKTTFLLILSLSLFPAQAEKLTLSYTELVDQFVETLQNGDSPNILETRSVSDFFRQLSSNSFI